MDSRDYWEFIDGVWVDTRAVKPPVAYPDAPDAPAQSGKTGLMVPMIEEIMAALSVEHPPLRFPADGGREPVDAIPGVWTRGGTSPGGKDFGRVDEASYFIGEKYTSTDYGAPQRIVWIPPRAGQERFLLGDSIGPRQSDSDADGAVIFRHYGSRTMPMELDLWCNDYDDLDVLVFWLCKAMRETTAGSVEAAKDSSLFGGGYANNSDEEGIRGVRYKLNVTFIFPLAMQPHVGHKFNFSAEPLMDLQALPAISEDDEE